jgi:hypothetical protein
MVSKFEYLSDSEIVENYKRLKELQRTKNKTAYEKLKQNKVKYRYRLNYELEQQHKRLEKIKLDEEAYKTYKEQKKYNNSLYYYNNINKKNDNDNDNNNDNVNDNDNDNDNNNVLTIYKK